MLIRRLFGARKYLSQQIARGLEFRNALFHIAGVSEIVSSYTFGQCALDPYDLLVPLEAGGRVSGGPNIIAEAE